MGSLFFTKLIGLALLLPFSTPRPTTKDDHVTMSGEPTHFQVDDKAAELEINANAMGVKVNAKPASLQVVSKPGAPSVPVARPAVVVPQLPAPYIPAPFYPSPMVIGHRRTTRRHHFFNTNSDMGNWNYKKTSVPKKQRSNVNKISKKSEISSKKKSNSKKRQWIQRLPSFTPILRYPQLTNIRVHPLVQQMAAFSQGVPRQPIPRLPYVQAPQTTLPQVYSLVQQSPGMSPSVVNGEGRSAINHPIFVPSFPRNQLVYAPPQATFFMPVFRPNLPYDEPKMIRAPLSGFNGYYDPVISRDFIPDLGSPDMPHIPVPTPRAFSPYGMTGGVNYPGYTPLGLWQRVNKRLNIPRKPSTDSRNGKAATVQKPRQIRSVKESREIIEKPTEKKVQGENIAKNPGENVAKRQFILTRPAVSQTQPIVTYVPVVSSPQLQAPVIAPPAGMRRNLVMNLPLKTSQAFVLNVPSGTRSSQMYQANPSGPVAGVLYRPVVTSGAFNNQQSNDVMGAQRSTLQAIGLQSPGAHLSGIGTQAPMTNGRMSLADLAGMQGQPIFENNRHLSFQYNNEPVPSQVQDQLFRESPLEGRTSIPRREPPRRFRYEDSDRFDEIDREEYPGDTDDESKLHEDEYPSYSPSNRVDDEGSYNEQIFPDGRTVFRKDHVGFEPITVQAKTAEAASRDRDNGVDMDLDSDKRKMIPRPGKPQSYLDKRLGIPKPDKEK